MLLRDYQSNIKAQCQVESCNVLIQLLAAITQDNTDVICIAHRNILIKQLSRELAKHAIHHGIIATTHTRRLCITEHRKIGFNNDKETGVYVSSIDSLLSRHRRGLLDLDVNKAWTIIVDEAHHMIEINKWGKLAEIFPNASFIGATKNAGIIGYPLDSHDANLYALDRELNVVNELLLSV